MWHAYLPYTCSVHVSSNPMLTLSHVHMLHRQSLIAVTAPFSCPCRHESHCSALSTPLVGQHDPNKSKNHRLYNGVSSRRMRYCLPRCCCRGGFKWCRCPSHLPLPCFSDHFLHLLQEHRLAQKLVHSTRKGLCFSLLVRHTCQSSHKRPW